MNHLYITRARVNKKTGEEKNPMSRNRKFSLLLLLLFSGLLSSSTISAQTLIAGWDFQTTATGGTAVLAAPNTPKVFNANFGSGTIYFDGTNNSSNWIVASSNSELSAFAGTAVNAGTGFSTSTTSPASLALLGGVGGTASNGKYAIFSFSMTGFINLTVTYASQRTSTGYNTQIWEYSTDGLNWTPFSTITTIPSSFGVITLPTTSGLDGAANAFLRFSGTGATAAAGNNRLDNIQLNATPGVTFNTDPVSGSPFCISDDNSTSVNVSFLYAGTPNPGNIYTAELSSSTGSFASPVAIGTLPSVAGTGTISATIPAGTLSGTGYRIRVTSSDPVATANDNGTNLIIDKVVATASNNSPVCAGLSLQLFSGGGATYSWTGPNSFSSGSQNPMIPVTVNADSGEFIATAISTLGCTDTAATVAIVQTCSCIPPTITSNSTMPNCNGGNNGSIDITVLGGASPYTFNWSTGAVTEDVSGLTAGIYSVIVTDAISCVDTFFVTVDEPTLITSSTTVIPPGCQGFSNGSIDLTVSGGTPGYTYLWDNGATTEDISGLSAGLYSVTITDANGCTSNNFGVVVDPGPFTITATGYDESCFGSNNGSIDLTASNDTMNNSNPGLLISEFLADPANADSSKEWVELVATKFINFSVTPYTVIVSNNGTATTNGWVQGGVASATTNGTYAFEISSGIVVPGEVVYVGGSNMAVNGRKLRVIDISTTGGDGGIGTATTGGIIGNGGPNADGIAVFNTGVATLTPASIPTDAVFFGTGTGNAVVLAGTAGFTLPVNDLYAGGFLQTGSFVAVNPGTSAVKAIGGYNTLTGLYTNRTWSTGTFTDDTTEIIVGSGNSFLWSNGATTEDISGLTGGTYSVTVTSNTGCTANLSVTINPASVINLSGNIFDVTCFGLNDGSIDITVSGGALPYTYLWNDGDINEDRSMLVTGTYIVTVTDANGCIVIDTFYVDQPADITFSTVVTNTSCFGASDGAIDLTVNGGTPPYQFSWSNGDVTEDIINQPAFFYAFNITDNNGCASGGLEFINEPNPIVITNFTPTAGGAGVLVTINGSGFTGATDVKFDNVSAASFTVISDLQIDAVVPAGTDTGYISVYTSPTCFTVSTDTFFYNPVACVPPALSATTTPVTCFGASDGSIDLTISGGLPPYTITWSNGANSEDIAGLIAGVYTVSVSDANTCPNSLTVTVSEPGQLMISGVVDSVSCNGGTDGSIDITVTGGTAPYTFSWSTGAATEDINGLSAGFAYIVTVIDASICAASASFDVFEPIALSTNVMSSDPLCAGQASGSIDPNVSGGTAPYTYLWSNGATSATLTGVPAGVYTVDITDDNGCLIAASATLVDPAPFTLSLVSTTDVSCPGGNDGAIDILASNDPPVPPVNPGLLISEFLADPAGTDNPNEWVELIATKSIDFSVTPYTVVVANNGTATVKGWRAGGLLTYAFQISSGVVNPGDVFYVGGSSMAPTGTKLRTINTVTTAGDGFGNIGGGIGNGGTNADAVAVFNVPSSLIDSTTIPVDALFFGTALGNAIVNGGLNGYTLPNNDRYAGGLLSAGAFIAPNSASGSHHVATGIFNYSTGVFTSIRNWTLNPTFTDGTSAITLSANNTYSWSNGATTQDISGLTAGTYTVTATNPDGCTATLSVLVSQPNALSIIGFTPGSGNTGTGVIISGSGFNAADEVWFNGVPAVFIINTDGQITATVPAGATTGPVTIINAGCDTVVSAGSFTINTNATFNLTMLIEGFYDGMGGLTPALLNSGVGLSASECDTVYVELRDQLNPLTVLASGTAVLNTNGQAGFTFPGSVVGLNGYIAVFHRNAVQTWSDIITFSSTTNYNFTTGPIQAFGSNMIAVAPGVYAFYSGDLSPQDEFIDILDQGVIDNDIANFASGYVVSDLNGDGFVDIVDQSIVDNNIFNFIGSVHP